MVANPEKSESLSLLILLLLSRRGVGSRYYREIVGNALNQISRNLQDSKLSYVEDVPIGRLLDDAYDSLNSRYAEPILGFRRGRYLEDEFDDIISRFFDKTESQDRKTDELERRVSAYSERYEGRLSSSEEKIRQIEDRNNSVDWSLSLGVPQERVRAYRTAPVRIYTLQSLPEPLQTKMLKEIIGLLEENGFSVDLDLPAVTNSFWKKLWVRTKNVATHEEVEERSKKLEKSLETKHYELPQAEANKLNADSVSSVMQSLGDIDDASVQLGNILIVKNTPIGEGAKKARVAVRTLTALEMQAIEKNQSLLKEPSTIIQQLESLCSSKDAAPIS